MEKYLSVMIEELKMNRIENVVNTALELARNANDLFISITKPIDYLFCNRNLFSDFITLRFFVVINLIEFSPILLYSLLNHVSISMYIDMEILIELKYTFKNAGLFFYCLI